MTPEDEEAQERTYRIEFESERQETEFWRRQALFRKLQFFFAAVGVTGAVLAGTFYGSKPTRPDTEVALNAIRAEQMTAELAQTKKYVAQIEAQVDALDKLLRRTSETPNHRALEVQVVKMSGSLESLSSRLLDLEGALSTTPAKALAVPLLRQDLTALKERQAEIQASTRSEIDRIYDQGKWFLGLMITFGLSVLLQAFIKPKDTPKRDTKEPAKSEEEPKGSGNGGRMGAESSNGPRRDRRLTR